MAQGFYVTIIKGKGSVSAFKPGSACFAAGPFAEHDEALGWVDMVRDYVLLTYSDAHWWSFGTTRIKSKAGKKLPPGKLNDRLSVAPSAPCGTASSMADAIPGVDIR